MHYNADNSYLFVNQKKSYQFKANDKNLNFPNQFFLGSIPKYMSRQKKYL